MPDQDFYDYSGQASAPAANMPPIPTQGWNYDYYSQLPPDTPTRAGVPLGLLTSMVKEYESNNNYGRLARMPPSVSAYDYPTDPSGHPLWPGVMNPGYGRSHGAGVAQWEPKLWHEASDALGITDFSQRSQDAALNWTAAWYGSQPWSTDRPLNVALDYARRTGQMPPPGYGWQQRYAGR